MFTGDANDNANRVQQSSASLKGLDKPTGRRSYEVDAGPAALTAQMMFRLGATIIDPGLMGELVVGVGES